MSEGNTTGAKAHLTFRKDILFEAASAKKMEFWTGPFSELLEKAKGYSQSMYSMYQDSDLPSGGSDTQGSGWSYPLISNISLQRQQGNIGSLSITITQAKQVAFATVDFVEISRPIICWRAWNGNNKPDISLIARWQKQKDASPENYAAFKTEDGTELSGDTKKLAEMIYKGIEHYSVYLPVVSVTLRTFSPPQLALYPIGKISTPEVPYGWPLAGGETIDNIIRDLKDSETDEAFSSWVISSSRSSNNADGTYTWVLQFQGCSGIENDLFSSPSASET